MHKKESKTLLVASPCGSHCSSSKGMSSETVTLSCGSHCSSIVKKAPPSSKRHHRQKGTSVIKKAPPSAASSCHQNAHPVPASWHCQNACPLTTSPQLSLLPIETETKRKRVAKVRFRTRPEVALAQMALSFLALLTPCLFSFSCLTRLVFSHYILSPWPLKCVILRYNMVAWTVHTDPKVYHYPLLIVVAFGIMRLRE